MDREKLYMYKDGKWLVVDLGNMGYKSVISYAPHVTEFPSQPLQGMIVYYSPPPIKNTLLRRIKMAWLVLTEKLIMQENKYD